MGTCGTRRSPGGRCWRSPPAPRSASSPPNRRIRVLASALYRPNADAAQGQTQAAHDSARCRAWRRRSRRDQPARDQGKNCNAGDDARAGTPAQGFRPVSRRADPAPGCSGAAARARRAGAPPPGRAAPVDPCRRAARSGHPRPVGLYAIGAGLRPRDGPSGLARKQGRFLARARRLSKQPPVIGAILLDLARRETNNRSLELARAIVTEAGREVRLLPKPHRSAGFAVLSAPDIPSALVEIGCLSNPEEERLLPTPSHQRRLAQALLRAIDDYFAGLIRI